MNSCFDYIVSLMFFKVVISLWSADHGGRVFTFQSGPSSSSLSFLSECLRPSSDPAGAAHFIAVWGLSPSQGGRIGPQIGPCWWLGPPCSPGGGCAWRQMGVVVPCPDSTLCVFNWNRTLVVTDNASWDHKNVRTEENFDRRLMFQQSATVWASSSHSFLWMPFHSHALLLWLILNFQLYLPLTSLFPCFCGNHFRTLSQIEFCLGLSRLWNITSPGPRTLTKPTETLGLHLWLNCVAPRLLFSGTVTLDIKSHYQQILWCGVLHLSSILT